MTIFACLASKIIDIRKEANVYCGRGHQKVQAYDTTVGRSLKKFCPIVYVGQSTAYFVRLLPCYSEH